MRQSLRKNIALSLLLLFVSYTAGITLFYHSHVINGVTIVHSHPFNKNSSHTHSAVELDLIHQLNHFVSTSPSVMLMVLFIFPLWSVTLLKKNISTSCSIPFFGKSSRRGPPVYYLVD